MARLLGVDLPKDKRVDVALTYIYGIGQATSRRVLEACNISFDRRTKDLTDKEVSDITTILQKLSIKTEGDLRQDVRQNIKRLMDIGCYRGMRHRKGLPVRGQRTHTNARTRKGPVKQQVAKKKAPSKK